MYEKIEELKRTAEQGDPDAQFYLGMCYATGKGVEQDYVQATKWRTKAAEQGHAEAQYALGLYYGSKQDTEQSILWYTKAAKQGHVKAQSMLGIHYHFRFYQNGVKDDYEQAILWYTKAAKQGDTDAQNNLTKLGVKLDCAPVVFKDFDNRQNNLANLSAKLDDEQKEKLIVDRNCISKFQGCIAAGIFHTVGLRVDGTVVATGDNQGGQCNVDGWRDITAISCGWYHTVGLREDGTVVANGRNNYGQCDVGGWRNIVAIAAGSSHTVGLRADGSIVATGTNEYGSCDVGGWRNIVAISACNYYTVGLRVDGTVVAIGHTEETPCDVGGWRNIVTISAGFFHIIGLRADGTVVATGDNARGICDVGGWRNIVAIAAGALQTVGLKEDGTVVATGESKYGECSVGGWRNIVAIVAGGVHSVGLRVDGTVVATGSSGAIGSVGGWRNIGSSKEYLIGLQQKKKAEQYARLLSRKKTVSSLAWKEFLQLAGDFRSDLLKGYENSAALAVECDRLAEKAKEGAYEQLLQAKVQADNRADPDIVEYRGLVKKFLEFGRGYKDVSMLSERCEQIARNQELKIQCDDLIAKISTASAEKDFRNLAEQFRTLGNYPDAVLQAVECDRLAEKAKAEAFDKLLQAKVQADNKVEAIVEYRGLVGRFLEFGSYNGADGLARECAGKAYAQEQKTYYDNLFSRMAMAVSEEDFDVLEEGFRAMRNYPDAVIRADECAQKAKPLKYANLISKQRKVSRVAELRELSERFRKLGNYLDSVMRAEECEKEATHRQAEYVSRGLCWNCGSEVGGGSFAKKLIDSLFTKKCKECGMTQR